MILEEHNRNNPKIGLTERECYIRLYEELVRYVQPYSNITWDYKVKIWK